MNRKLPRHTPLIFVTIIAVIYLLISYIPSIYEISLTPLVAADRIMLPGEHIYTYDYNVYLSKILQGIEGRLTVVNKYDHVTEAPGALLQLLYVISGFVLGKLGLNQVLIFHTLRTVFAITWVILIVRLNVHFLKKPVLYIPGVLLSLLASSYPAFYDFEGATWVGSHMSWWQELDVLKRVSYIPHYLFNYAVIAALTLLMTSLTNPKNKRNFKIILVLLFTSFFVHPTGGLIFLFSWVWFLFFTFIFDRSLTASPWIHLAKRTMIIFSVAAIPMLYLRYVTQQYPWSSLVEYDKTTPLPFNFGEYLLALGPVTAVGFLGMLLVILYRDKKMLPVLTWVLAALTGIVVFNHVPEQSVVRFVQSANHVPLAILSIYCVYTLTRATRHKFVHILPVLVIFPMIILGLVHTHFSLKAQKHFIHQRAVAGYPLVPYPSQVMYPLKDVWNGVGWLAGNTENEEVVLTKITMGNYIPAYAGNFVHLGHNPETPNFWEREGRLTAFYTGTFSPDEARTFLSETRVSYIFHGPQEKDNMIEPLDKYDFLTPVYTSPHVTIYQVAQ